MSNQQSHQPEKRGYARTRLTEKEGGRISIIGWNHIMFERRILGMKEDKGGRSEKAHKSGARSNHI